MGGRHDGVRLTDDDAFRELGAGRPVCSPAEPRYETVAEPARALIPEHRQTSGEVTLDERPEMLVEQ